MTAQTGTTVGAFAELWTGNAFNTIFDFEISSNGVTEAVSLRTETTVANSIRVFLPTGSDNATRIGNVFPEPLTFRVRKLTHIDENNNELGRWLDPIVLSNVEFTTHYMRHDLA